MSSDSCPFRNGYDVEKPFHNDQIARHAPRQRTIHHLRRIPRTRIFRIIRTHHRYFASHNILIKFMGLDRCSPCMTEMRREPSHRFMHQICTHLLLRGGAISSHSSATKYIDSTSTAIGVASPISRMRSAITSIVLTPGLWT